MTRTRSSAYLALSRIVTIVGMVGRLAPWKGQDVFMRAFAQAFADQPGGAGADHRVGDVRRGRLRG